MATETKKRQWYVNGTPLGQNLKWAWDRASKFEPNGGKLQQLFENVKNGGSARTLSVTVEYTDISIYAK